MKKHPVYQQYNYHKWANERVFDHLSQLPEDVFTRQVDSVFASVREVVVHIYLTDGMWLSVISGDAFRNTLSVIKQLKNKSLEHNLEGLRKCYSEVAEGYDALLNEQNDPDREITIEHPKYGKMESPVSSLITHVVNHGTYHRGNITAMLRQQGHAGTPTDFVHYLFGTV